MIKNILNPKKELKFKKIIAEIKFVCFTNYKI